MKFELFGWELETKKKEKRNIVPKEPKPRNEFDEVLKKKEKEVLENGFFNSLEFCK